MTATDLEKKLMSLVPKDGSLISNGRLREALELPKQKYQSVRDSLIEQGLLVSGKGRGGSVRLAEASSQDDQFLMALRGLGGSSPNKRLREALCWSEERYFQVRDRLVDNGSVRKGPGRGGSVHILQQQPREVQEAGDLEEQAVDSDGGREDGEPGIVDQGRDRGGSVRFLREDQKQAYKAAENQQEQALKGYEGREEGDQEGRAVDEGSDGAWSREEALYAPVAQTLQEHWARDRSFKWFRLEITAKQGRRQTGGRWTRPDITVVSLSRYRYIPGQHLEVWTFEIKTKEAADVTAVYEAVAHTRFATRAYVAFPVSEEPSAEETNMVSAIVAEATRHGIGVFTMTNPEDYDTWEERVEPSRSDAEYLQINSFIAAQLTNETKSDLQDQLRGAS